MKLDKKIKSSLISRHVRLARKALKAYRGSTKPDEGDMRDLLCDLMHHSAMKRIDFDNELRIARDNFEAEGGWL